jgi:Restriction endonuclease S subunits
MLYKLSDVFDLQMGKTPSRDNNMYWKDGNLPWVSIADLSKSQIYIENSKEMITNLAAKDTLMKCIPQDTVIMSFKLSLGKTAITKTPLYTNEAIMAFIDKKVIQIEPKYIYFLFRNIKWGQYTNNAVKGKTLNKKFFSDFQIYIPEYTQQTKIASILIRINKILEYKHSLIKAYDAIIKSRFVDLFGDIELNEKKWKKIKFGELIKSANNGLARRGNDKAGNIVLRLIELQENLINYSDPNRILLTDDEKKRYRLLEGDLLFARVNGNPKNVGRCATFYEYKEQVYHNDHIIRTSCDKSQLDSVFAAYLFNSEYGKNKISRKIKTSAGQYTINQEGLKSIEIILPPIVKQYSFAEFIKQINKLKSDVQKSIDETQLLMDSLMQEYFG